jgi:hypothetical protein
MESTSVSTQVQEMPHTADGETRLRAGCPRAIFRLEHEVDVEC